MAENNPAPEQQPTNEVFKTANRRVALQARLLLGGQALSADNISISKVTPDKIVEIKKETVDIINTASTTERAQHWKDKGAFDDQLKLWCQNLVEYTNNPAFTIDHAKDVYDHYFGQKGNGSSNVGLYVDEMIREHIQDGVVNFDLLQEHLPDIKKFANIFGGNASEIIEDLILAQVKFITPEKKQELIDQVGEEKNIDGSPTLRINYLNPEEEKLLKWLNQPSIEDAGQTGGEFYWKYERLNNDVRIFPRELTYAKLAHDLKTDNPAEFGKYDVRELSGYVKKQLEATQAALDKFGMTQQEMANLSFDFVDKEVLSHYRNFIQSTYNITLPATESIQILPISGAIAQAHDRTGRALAFVDARYPVIFLNVDNIAKSCRQITGKPWEILTLEDRKQYFKRLLTEINPHEYTHLMGDLAFWELTSKDSHGKEQELESFTGKLGLKTAKPRNLHQSSDNSVEFNYLERGRGLMEAVTVELTKQWVETMGAELTKIYGRPMDLKLDIPAYPAERQVLYALENLISQDKSITDAKAFEIFVKSYFTPNGFREIVETLDNHKKIKDHEFVTQRPHFTSIIYSLMEYESKKNNGVGTGYNYPLTLNFIWGKLTPEQKLEISSNLDRLEISPEVKRQLTTTLQTPQPQP